MCDFTSGISGFAANFNYPLWSGINVMDLSDQDGHLALPYFSTDPAMQKPRQSEAHDDSHHDGTELQWSSTTLEQNSLAHPEGFSTGLQTSDFMSICPRISTADDGTYSCTYYQCPRRFETVKKLNEHKRSHRNQQLASGILKKGNGQAGPHRCDRINVATGKSCDTTFSRPYDLTRHEDTIHNLRKRKIRCVACTEEKTFSRADALARHCRVYHPELGVSERWRRRMNASRTGTSGKNV